MFETLKKDFPLLSKKIDGNSIVYCDNAATTQKPSVMIDAIVQFYQNFNAPVYRAVYTLAEQATELYEASRQTVANYINARCVEEIIFTKGATEGLNNIMFSWALSALHEGDEIVLTELEHHSNLLIWQYVVQYKKVKLVFIPVYADGTVDMNAAEQLITKSTKLVSVVHVSNAVGTHVDVEAIVRRAREVGAYVIVDASQSAGHQKIDVQKLDCDFLVFSGHKMMGPTGIGVLYARKELHEAMEPFLYGGGMVHEADYDSATFLKAPHKFEAGSLPVAQAVGLAAAITYINNNIDFEKLRHHEAGLCARLIDGLVTIPGIKVLGNIEQLKSKGHLVSFVHESIHSHDIAAYVNQYGICVRTGHFCAQPLAKKLGFSSGAVRVSFYLYNTLSEVDLILSVLQKACEELV